METLHGVAVASGALEVDFKMAEDILLNTILILGIAALICVMGYALIWNHNSYEVRVNACIELGYADIGDINSMSAYGTCADSNDDLHFVKWICDGYWMESCSAKNIKQGDVTGVLR